MPRKQDNRTVQTVSVRKTIVPVRASKGRFLVNLDDLTQASRTSGPMTFALPDGSEFNLGIVSNGHRAEDEPVLPGLRERVAKAKKGSKVSKAQMDLPLDDGAQPGTEAKSA